MWWPLTDACSIYVTGSSVRARRKTGPFWRPVIEETGNWEWDADDPASLKLDAIRREGKRTSLHVAVGAALCKLAVVPLPSGVDDGKEQLAIARVHMCDQLGLDAAEWEFSINAARTPGHVVACALKSSLLKRLRVGSAAAGIELQSVRPLAANIWNMAGIASKKDAGSTAMIAVEDDAFTTLVEIDGKFVAAGTLLHGRNADLLDRERQRLGLLFGKAVGQGAAAWLSPAMAALAGVRGKAVKSADEPARSGVHFDFRDVLLFAERGDANGQA